MARLITCPACGVPQLEISDGSWKGAIASCRSCGAHARQAFPWLSRSLGGLIAALTYGMLTGIDPFNRTISWVQRGAGLLALVAAVAALWWAERRWNPWRVSDDPHRRGAARVWLLPVALITATIFLSAGGIALGSHRDGQTLPLSPPSVLQGTAEIMRNRALRGRFVDQGKGPGSVRGVVVDVGFPDRPLTIVVDPDGGTLRLENRAGVRLGAETRESVGIAGRQLCESAARVHSHFRQFRRLLPGFPHAEAGRVRFYLTTDDSLLEADADLSSLVSASHPLSELWRHTKVAVDAP